VHGNFQSNSITALRNVAENGQGIVVMPEFAAAPSLAAGRLVAILRQYTTVKKPITVLYPHRGLVPTRTTVFVDMLTRHIPKALAAIPCPPPSQRDADVGGSIEIARPGGDDRAPPAPSDPSFPRGRRVDADVARG